MVKIDRVMAQGFLLREGPSRAQSQAQEVHSTGDKVSISEEGMKRRVLGQVMASIAGPDVKTKG